MESNDSYRVYSIACLHQQPQATICVVIYSGINTVDPVRPSSHPTAVTLPVAVRNIACLRKLFTLLVRKEGQHGQLRAWMIMCEPQVLLA